MPAALMQHTVDPREKLLSEVGDISGFSLHHNQVLCAVYIRPDKTASGLFLPNQTTDEDRYQSKVGLVLKKGPDAFVDPENKWFRGIDISEGDWIVFRPSETWSVTVNGVLCRIVDDTLVRGTVTHPDQVW